MNDTGMIRLHHPSLSDTVREELVRLIVTGLLKPGQRLNEVHLAERLGVSRGPIREAARELEGQGLIVSRPRLGFYVADFSATEIVDLYEIKIWIDRALIQDVIRYWPDEARQATLAGIDLIDRLRLGQRRRPECILRHVPALRLGWPRWRRGSFAASM